MDFKELLSSKSLFIIKKYKKWSFWVKKKTILEE